MNVERINPYLNVKNLIASIDYYSRILGFSLVAQTDPLAIVDLGGHEIHLRLTEGEVHPNRVWIGVGDILPFYEVYKEKGTAIMEEPTNYPWAYQMIIADPDGNLLIFGSGPLDE